ncbi:MAG: transposase [Clostridiales bacterium]|nr:transposase [Clostridiales bacterium]
MERKNIRLKEYDYSRNGAYFITICTKDKKQVFWNIVGADIIRPGNYVLSKYGQIADNVIIDIPNHYNNIFVDKYVIMPNHIHLILKIERNINGRIISAPTISTVVGQMKRKISKLVGFDIWQKSFYDHIIRNQHDYQQIWKYIDDNPLKWELDKYYNEV